MFIDWVTTQSHGVVHLGSDLCHLSVAVIGQRMGPIWQHLSGRTHHFRNHIRYEQDLKLFFQRKFKLITYTAHLTLWCVRLSISLHGILQVLNITALNTTDSISLCWILQARNITILNTTGSQYHNIEYYRLSISLYWILQALNITILNTTDSKYYYIEYYRLSTSLYRIRHALNITILNTTGSQYQPAQLYTILHRTWQIQV